MDQEQQKLTIMIVEDDVFMGSLLEKKFQQENFEIFRANNVDEARNILNSNPVQLILLDIILPGTDGITFLKELKASDQLRNIPVIITSNLGQPEEIQNGLKEGANDYIVKAHTSPGEIVQKVRFILTGK